jgi:hypothetical protein
MLRLTKLLSSNGAGAEHKENDGRKLGDDYNS